MGRVGSDLLQSEHHRSKDGHRVRDKTGERPTRSRREATLKLPLPISHHKLARHRATHQRGRHGPKCAICYMSTLCTQLRRVGLSLCRTGSGSYSREALEGPAAGASHLCTFHGWSETESFKQNWYRCVS